MEIARSHYLKNNQSEIDLAFEVQNYLCQQWITEWAPDQVKRLQWLSEKEQKGIIIKLDGVPYLQVAASATKEGIKRKRGNPDKKRA